jgi:hypothetical protein
MRNIQGQSLSCSYRSIKGTGSYILTAVMILVTSGVICAQEPVVVTTVRQPVETVKKDSVTPPEPIRTGSVPDTVRKATVIAVSDPASRILKSNSVASVDMTSIGFGLGQDYGGLGGNILYYPHRSIGMFFGIGYNFVGVGSNVGVKSRIVLGTSSNSISLSAIAMYGYNATIIVENSRDLTKVFSGFTVGIGIDLRPWAFNSDFVFLGLNFPIRKPEVQEYINTLKSNYNVEFDHELIPVTFSIGYRITLN